MQDMETDYIRQGDCLELMKGIPDESVDMALCDLPYGTTSCKWDNIIPFESLWEQYKRIIKPNGAILLFGTEPFSSVVRMSNQKMYRYDWYWKKSFGSNFLNLKKQPYFVVETVSVFYSKQPTYNPQMVQGAVEKRTQRRSGLGSQQKYGIKKRIISGSPDGLHYPNNVIDVSFGNSNRLHPTQKPVDLLRYFIRTYTNEGELVLDNTMGSGSTCVAAIQEKRHYIGFELQPEYFEIAKKRIEDEKKQLTLF